MLTGYKGQKLYHSANVFNDCDVRLHDDAVLCLMEQLSNTDWYYRSTSVSIYIAWRSFHCFWRSLPTSSCFWHGKRSI